MFLSIFLHFYPSLPGSTGTSVVVGAMGASGASGVSGASATLRPYSVSILLTPVPFCHASPLIRVNFALSRPFLPRFAPYSCQFCSLPPLSATLRPFPVSILLAPVPFCHTSPLIRVNLALSRTFLPRFAPYSCQFCSLPSLSATLRPFSVSTAAYLSLLAMLKSKKRRCDYTRNK